MEAREREAVKNPPDFVMYVVMVKKHRSGKFNPNWWEFLSGTYTKGYQNKSDVERKLKEICKYYGKNNVYVQQYGPYS